MNSDSKKVNIFINGVKYQVRADIPLGASLYEKGIYAFERSMRFNRPRGLMVFDWRGPEKIYLEEDFEKNPYVIYPKEGMKIKINLKSPLPKGLINLFKGYLRVGGYNKWPFNRLWAWNIALKYVNDILPWNEPKLDTTPPNKYPQVLTINTDILVIGGGLGGLMAALSASSNNIKVVLIEADSEIGGYISLYDEDSSIIKDIVGKLRDKGVHLLNNLIFEGFFEDTAIGYKTDTEQLVKFNYKSIIFATGTYEIPALYENNDLPKTLLASAALKLLKYGVSPGKRGVIIGSTDRALETALKLHKKGIEVVIIGSNFKGPKYDELKEQVSENGIMIYEKVDNVKALGDDKVEGIKILTDGKWMHLNVDFIVHAPYIIPEVEIIRMTKIDLAFDLLLGGFVPIHSIDGSTKIDNVYIAGSVGGVIPSEIYSKIAKATGLKAAEYIGKSLPEEYDEILGEAIQLLKNNYSNYYNALNRLAHSFSSGGKYEYYDGSFPTYFGGNQDNIYVCFCTDVTLNDLKHVSLNIGFDIMEHIKRYSGSGTGRCQGRRCVVNTILGVSKFTSKNPSQVGTIRCRPPYVPIPLYLFGGEGSEV